MEHNCAYLGTYRGNLCTYCVRVCTNDETVECEKQELLISLILFQTILALLLWMSKRSRIMRFLAWSVNWGRIFFWQISSLIRGHNEPICSVLSLKRAVKMKNKHIFNVLKSNFIKKNHWFYCDIRMKYYMEKGFRNANSAGVHCHRADINKGTLEF